MVPVRLFADLERDDRLQRNLADITGKGYASAFDTARQQFNTEQQRQQAGKRRCKCFWSLMHLQRKVKQGTYNET